MPTNAAGQVYGGFAPTGVPEDPYRSQFRNSNGQLMNDTGDNAQLMYSSLIDPTSDASKSFNFLGRSDNGAGLADQYRGQGALRATAPQANLSQDNAARQTQMGLAGAYQARFEGRGPSNAGIAAQRGMDAASAQAAAGRVNAGAAGQRAAMLRGGVAGLGAAQGAADMRSQEMFSAGQGMGNVATQMRGGDASAALRQGQLNLQSQGLNDQRQGAYEDFAQGINEMGMHGATARADAIKNVHALGVSQFDRIQAANKARRQAEEDMSIGIVGAGASAIPMVGGAVKGLAGAGR